MAEDLDDELFTATPSLASFVTITQGMRGHFAVLMYWNDEDADGNRLPPGQGFWEPFQTGIGSYRTADEAAREGREWADAEGLAFRR